MRRQLIRIEESNIAGFRWWSELWLSQSRKGGYRLSVTRSETHVDHDEIGPVDAITSGKQLFEQVGNILNQLGHDQAETHHAAIADALSDIDVRLAEQYRRAPKLIAASERRAFKQKQVARERKIAPFIDAIEQFCVQFPDDLPTASGGGLRYKSRQSTRASVRGYMQTYLLEYGHLPRGNHEIELFVGKLTVYFGDNRVH